MQGDLCDRPDRNARPKPLNDTGLSESGIILSPNQGGPSNNNGNLNLLGDSNSLDKIDESSTYSSDSSEFNTNPNENDGNIFGRLFGNGSGVKSILLTTPFTRIIVILIRLTND